MEFERIPFESLGLKDEVEVVEITIGDCKEVKVKTYLSIEEKVNAITFALSDAVDPITGLIDKAKAEALLHIYIVLFYTNIQLNDKNLLAQYDILEANGAIDAIVSSIPENEYDALIDYFEMAVSDFDKRRLSVAGAIYQLFDEFPTAMEGINSSLGQFDSSKYAEVMNIVKAVGGNQDAVTNLLYGQK